MKIQDRNMTAEEMWDMFVDMSLYMALMQTSVFKRELDDIFKDDKWPSADKLIKTLSTKMNNLDSIQRLSQKQKSSRLMAENGEFQANVANR